MKKNGFTLAEVLITLAIIGVVATMTLPALMNNVGEQQYITGLKKGINTLTEAAQMSKAVDGIDYADLTDSSTNGNDLGAQNSLAALFRSRLNMDLAKTDDLAGNLPKFGGDDQETGNFAVYLRDGSAIYYKPSDTVDADRADKLADGLPRGYVVIYDVNGTKGPNIFSNCNAKGGANSSNAKGDQQGETDDCNTQSKRVIGDQFGLRLRGSVVQPLSGAAEWAYNK